ncbi:hypothetical protein [Virgibacillus salexigens]|nr:hypothetical protein [Virgibacillus massiliensis]MYL43989.1 hypothetical protein [Virgibacillus massiliensis]
MNKSNNTGKENTGKMGMGYYSLLLYQTDKQINNKVVLIDPKSEKKDD